MNIIDEKIYLRTRNMVINVLDNDFYDSHVGNLNTIIKILLHRAGVEENPGPTIWICSVCQKRIQKSISVKCNSCEQWCHLKPCSGLKTEKDYTPNFMAECCLIGYEQQQPFKTQLEEQAQVVSVEHVRKQKQLSVQQIQEKRQNALRLPGKGNLIVSMKKTPKKSNILTKSTAKNVKSTIKGESVATPFVKPVKKKTKQTTDGLLAHQNSLEEGPKIEKSGAGLTMLDDQQFKAKNEKDSAARPACSLTIIDKKAQYYCSVCHKTIRNNTASVKCTGCHFWCHFKPCSSLKNYKEWNTDFIASCCRS